MATLPEPRHHFGAGLLPDDFRHACVASSRRESAGAGAEQLCGHCGSGSM